MNQIRETLALQYASRIQTLVCQALLDRYFDQPDDEDLWTELVVYIETLNELLAQAFTTAPSSPNPQQAPRRCGRRTAF